MGVLEGIEESIQKKQNNKNGFNSNKKYTKSYKKFGLLLGLKIRKGMELGGNHDMWWPPVDL